MTQHQSGALVEAERHYRHILALFPGHADSLHNLGLIALRGGNATSAVDLLARAIGINDRIAEYHYNLAVALRALNRMDDVATHLERAIELRGDHALAHLNLGNVRREQGRLIDALACYERAIALDPNLAGAHFNIGNMLSQQRRWDGAVSAYLQALARDATHAETHSALGVALMAQGRNSEAIAYLERAVTLKGDLTEACEELAKAYAAAGKPDMAAFAAGRALELKPTPQRKSLFAQCAKSTRFTSDEGGRYRKLLLQALIEGWARPRELTGTCISLIKLNGVVHEWIVRVNLAWPTRLPTPELLGATGLSALSADELLGRLLEFDPITDIGLERLLTNVRRTMLALATDNDQVADQQLLKFFAAVARQCFINDFLYALPADEAARARDLLSILERALKDGTPVPPLWPITLGAYLPLHTLAATDALLARPWPACVDALLVQQVKEPAQERHLAATIPILTGIYDEVSRTVRRQYEQNPYPRWIKAGSLAQSCSLTDSPPMAQAAEVLIAGCGTGLSAIDFALQMRNAHILAIDLSLASLSYAKRMAENFDLSNLEFGQADLVMLGSIGRRFDFIDASGVLHHLADPWQGWKVLLSLLRPGGVMQVGLYSELARQNIVAARALIAERGYRPIPEDIRRCREEIVASSDPMLNSLIAIEDFFTTSECRDLLFHVQEHRITLPDIKSFLAANDVQFAGFILQAPTLERFAARFPDRAALLELDCWHAFETEAPGTFAGMYQFWVRKRAVVLPRG